MLDRLAANERRRRVSALAIAISINLIVLTLLSVFARVRIWIPNAPSATINVTLVEIPRLELPELRDPALIPLEKEPEPELEPDPEPEPEIVEEPEPEPEPEPDPITEPEAPAEPEPEPEIIEEQEPEPEIVEQPEAEPELNLDLEPDFAPPAEDPEPLIPDPTPAAEDDLTLPAPEEDVVEQTPVEEDPEPLVSVEPEQNQEAGLDELLGETDAEGEDEAGEEGVDTDPALNPEEELLAEEETEDAAPQNDDIFDQEPTFSSRRFIKPRVQLPLGEAPIVSGTSGVVAIFCPEEFDDENKAAECAGRRQILSGWKPGDSGEDYSGAVELLQQAREQGKTGPELDKLVSPAGARRIQDQRIIDSLRNPGDDDDVAGAISQGGDDNILRGVEGNRPDIGPSTPQPGWATREDGELTQKEIDELEEALREAEEKK